MTTFDSQNEIGDTDLEGYQLDVNDVAKLLGVTRTRVSQLTSNGQLSFERRRVGSRNRLFYKRSEVLLHQRDFYGRHLSKVSQTDSQPGFYDSPQIVSIDSPRAGASAQAHLEYLLTEHQNSKSFLQQNSDESHLETRTLLRTVLSRLAEPSFEGRRPSNSLSPAAKQGDEDAQKQIVQQLINEIARLSQEIQKQHNLIHSLSDEMRTNQKNLSQILQSQVKLNSTLMHRKSHPPVESAIDTSSSTNPDFQFSVRNLHTVPNKKERLLPQRKRYSSRPVSKRGILGK